MKELIQKVVLSELDGDEPIWTQLAKLSEDNWNDPVEQLEFEVLAVTELLSIASEKVTEMLSVLIEMPLRLSVG